ncbi:PASTA domain-containing protein [Ferruginibacter lapsinanis]|uniref:PASTA domain-containing protein n=1 Tax=Ferruginibacter lapsinanis TaxID=563172 RepID=UPI001E44272D|nr:PASTA domain-containing protein [Ferruginibacter lapsinanis]UEG48683.1 PASTA domain-containing protein [Ferruginibacter lapsinanis]
MFKFITDKPLWVNFVAAVVLLFTLVFVLLQMLSWITKHGEYLTVPSLVGKDTHQAIELLESKGFDVVIQDSVYTDTVKRGTVIKQLPDGGSTVKVNRSVFLTINRYVPPMIEMPKLEGLSLRFALDLLRRNHLELRDTIYKPDFMMGSVLEQQYNGQRISPGQKLQWGSAITLIIGGGLQDAEILVPDLVGMRFAEAKAALDSTGISIGAIISETDIKDTASAFIYKQNPERFNEEKQPMYIHSGQVMDIWISPVMIYLKDTLNNQ